VRRTLASGPSAKLLAPAKKGLVIGVMRWGNAIARAAPNHSPPASALAEKLRRLPADTLSFVTATIGRLG
jgi:hypothetical protein